MQKKILFSSMLFLGICFSFVSAKELKYHPQNKEELKALVQNPQINLGEIDTSEITAMSELFSNSNRMDFSGIENWDTSNVTNMDGIFYETIAFNENINYWDTSKVWSMEEIFYSVASFNQSLNAWDVSKVENMSYMFMM